MERKYISESETVIKAIKEFNNNPAGLANFELYLSMHFATWLEKYANNPGNMASEMYNFSQIK